MIDIYVPYNPNLEVTLQSASTERTRETRSTAKQLIKNVPRTFRLSNGAIFNANNVQQND